MRKLFAVAFFAVFLVSCNSDDEQPALATNNDDYHPNTRGTTWNYSGFFATTVKMTGNTKKINGTVYAQVKATIPEFGGFSVISYLKKENGNYYYRGEGYKEDYLFLKDNAEVGTTWTAQVETEDGIEENELEIYEVGGTYFINDFTFDDVIIVKVTSYDEEDPEFTYVTYNYYAKGVGLVLTTDGTEFFNQTITSFTIK